ncbi:long-chain fatty acid--CoA ligase [Paludibacter sp. 221]|uniref:AMP-binding protein n=1 Tax=Paludibacter sp. 221 TaxID=2302939 RepID=UPI0013D77593|nr:AMP-binding protein [Paludibacter sp. 221]NDV46439.1 long-chain fatty acid--CoA ligase [Paludibacter sp. 221]
MVKENLIRLFEDSFRSNWDLPGYSDYGEDKTLTYADISKKIAKLHVLFEQCNIQRNDKIALIGRNSANWAITYLATITYGAIIVPILQDFNPNDVHHIANHSESKLLFTGENIWESLEEEKLAHIKAVFSLRDFNCIAILNQKKFTKDNTEDSAPVEPADILDRHRLQPDSIKELFYGKYPNGFFRDCVRYVDKPNTEIVSINYTSGTTGFSKGVLTSGNALAGNITFGFRTKLVAPGYRIVSFLPLAHAYGCAFDFLASTCAGCHIHFIGKTPSPKILLKAFAEVKPSVVFTVPLIIEKIYKKQILPLIAKPAMRWVLSIPLLDQTILAQIRKKLIDAFGGEFSEIVIGGAPLNAEVEDFFYKMKFPFTVGYGMTECAPLISYANKKDFAVKSCGKILDIMEVKIKDPDPETGTGEICVRGENVMDGYYKNEEATNQVFEDGWLLTGDLGTVDEKGNIFIRGRAKTMILSGSGQNIYPEEIEAKLDNMPYVMESLVVENQGKLVALVYPDYEAVDSQHLSQEQLEAKMEENRQAVNAILGAYEKIIKIQLYPHEFEKTPKKSIKRYLYQSNFQK